MSAQPTRFLTGITPSGTPHLGNYAGMMRPAIAATRTARCGEALFSGRLPRADQDAKTRLRIHRSTLEIAATWLACGLDPEQVTFYRQSDIPEITELTWFLTCVTGKGLLNRAHAYKAARDKNTEAGREPDDGVTAGLFMYPVLMAADILMFNAHKVPVGRDQIQHIEMARDIAASFNHLYGEHFTLPEAAGRRTGGHPGRSGRPQDEQELRQHHPAVRPAPQLQEADRLHRYRLACAGRAQGRPKARPCSSSTRPLPRPRKPPPWPKPMPTASPGATPRERLFACIDREIAPMRARYEDLMAHPHKVEAILQAGAGEGPRLGGALGAAPAPRRRPAPPDGASGQRRYSKSAKLALPSFKQYREKDGKFYFKLVDAQGKLLLQSLGLDFPAQMPATPLPNCSSKALRPWRRWRAQIEALSDAARAEALQASRNYKPTRPANKRSLLQKTYLSPSENGPMRIAILEDDPQQLHMMEQMVHSMGHTCVGYPTGAQLTKDLRRESFDLLILDWELPDTSGPEVATWTRQELRPDLPILIVTLRSEETDIVHGLHSGADDFMSKPLRVAEVQSPCSGPAAPRLPRQHRRGAAIWPLPLGTAPL